jgi:internalin A
LFAKREARRRIEAALETESTSLDLSDLNLIGLPRSLRKFTSLQNLDLSGNRFLLIPLWFDQLGDLRTLNLNGTGLGRLPEQLRGLSELRELSFRGVDDPKARRLTELPNWFAALHRLRRLDLSHNRLDRLPAAIGSLPDLAWLDLSWNPDLVPGEELGRLGNLRQLYLERCNGQGDPEWLGRLSGLTHLNLRLTVPRAIPDALGGLVHLEYLDLGANLLDDVPGSLTNLTGLRNLNLSGNRLSGLPPWLGEFAELTNLDVAYNRLTELPQDLGRLTNLEFLDVERNELDDLPTSLGTLPNIRDLRIAGNPLPDLDPALIAAGTDAVLDYLRSKQTTGEVRNNRSRVLVVGEPAVGKTSLIRALTGLDHRPGEATTHGMSISALSLPSPRDDEAVMDLAVWDFGGQPNYQSCHQFFFSGRSLFVVVWNTRNGAERDNVVSWIETIAARAPGAPVLVVATHANDRAADLDASLLQRFPQIVGVCAVDCAEPRTGLGELTSLIAEAAAELPLMGTVWPRSWDRAARALRGLDVPQISHDELRRIMTDARVESVPEQDRLTEYLHSLGDLIYPETTMRRVLGTTVTLDASWLNTRISQVLDRQEVADRGGVLTRGDLDAVWADLDPEKQSFLLAMIEEYDLGYPIADGDATDAVSLLMDLLPEAEPDLAAWTAAGADPATRRVRIRYRPGRPLAGIPAWFIAREHRFTTGRAWRRGVLLHDSAYGDLALLRTHRDGTVDLEVRSQYAPARFFGVLDDGLQQIFDRYPGQQVAREIPCPCVQSPHADCTEIYAVSWVLGRLAKGRTKFECRETENDIDLAELLDGIAPPRGSLVLTGGGRFPEARDREDRIYERLLGLLDAADLFGGPVGSVTQASLTQASLGAQLQREFSRNQHVGLQAAEVRCPSVITVEPVDKHVGRSVYRLHLWCEQPGAWHRLPDDSGSYELTEPDRWLRELNTYLQRIGRILRVTVPLAKGAVDVLAHEVDGHAKDDLKAIRRHLDRLAVKATTIGGRLDILERPGSDPRKAAVRDSDFRVLEQLLITHDPSRRWGGLNRTLTPEGQVLYLCAAHEDEYRARSR